MKPIAYEGSEPYIFASYAHKDANLVFEVLDELQRRGYRLWYDDGIAPGSEWPEDIAQHLDGAHMVMAFITPNSMASQNCRREINFSLSREKPFLSILLEPTKMPLGMEMQLSAQQMIVRDNFDSWDRFISKILSCRSLGPCKAEEAAHVDSMTSPASNPDPLPEQLPEPDLLVQPEPIPLLKAEGSEEPSATYQPVSKAEWPSPTENPLPEAAVNQQPQASEQAASPAKKGRKPGIGKVLGIAGAGILALLAIVLALRLLLGGSAPKTYTASWGSEINLESKYVNVTGQTVSQDDLVAMASIPELATMNLENCDLSACDFQAANLPSDTLRTLDLNGSTGITDYSFLSSLPVKELDLSGCSTFDDLSLVDTSSLAILHIDGTSVSDLGPLANTSLQTLSLSNTPVSDLTPLSTITALRLLECADTAVTSIDVLSTLERLESISFDGCSLSNPTTTFASLSLKSLSFADTGITNLDAFANCTILKSVDLEGNEQLADMTWLNPQNYETLEKLNLAHTALGADGLSWVSSCGNLTSLVLDGLALPNIEFCRGLANLVQLSAVNCGITDIDPLTVCHGLQVVLLGHNRIENVDALSGLTGASSSRVILDLSYNALSSVDALPAGNYKAIMLQGNGSDVALTIPDGIDGYEIVVTWCEGIEASKSAYQSISRVYLLGCPQNQVLAVQEAFHSKLVLVDEEALRAILSDDSFEFPLRLDHNPYREVS